MEIVTNQILKEFFNACDDRTERFQQGKRDQINGKSYEHSADPLWQDGFLASLSNTCG